MRKFILMITIVITASFMTSCSKSNSKDVVEDNKTKVNSAEVIDFMVNELASIIAYSKEDLNFVLEDKKELALSILEKNKDIFSEQLCNDIKESYLELPKALDITYDGPNTSPIQTKESKENIGVRRREVYIQEKKEEIKLTLTMSENYNNTQIKCFTGNGKKVYVLIIYDNKKVIKFDKYTKYEQVIQ